MKKSRFSCNRCGRSFETYPYEYNSGVGKFCSLECRYQPRPLSQHSALPHVMCVPLADGPYALIDDDDAIEVSRHSWRSHKGRNTMYAINGSGQSLHRLVMRNTLCDGFLVDHVNGDGLDCRKGNLRTATKQQNQANRKGAQSNSSSGIRGVSWDKSREKWAVNVAKGGRSFFRGRFHTLEQAKAAWREAAKAAYGEFGPIRRPT